MAEAARSDLAETPSIPTHPEEMKAVFDVRVGKFASLQGSARITPAGVVTTGIATFAILAGVAMIIRATRS